MRGRWQIAAGMACAALSGCAGFWDDVTAHDFDVKAYFNPPEPMTVLRTSTDGDARAKAFARLEEPAKRGGTQADQDEAVKLLSQAAIGDAQPLCRMAAIQTLGRFQDPRVVTTLKGAYETADQLTPDVAFMVRIQCTTAMGETHRPEAATFLADIARQPAKTDLSDRERGQSRDVRLAAVRSLRNFPGSQTAATTTQELVWREKDVAVRDRAKESYVALTGKEPPAAPTTVPSANPVATVGYSQPANH